MFNKTSKGDESSHYLLAVSQQFSAAVFRSSFPQQFSAAVFRSSFPQQFS